MAAAVFCAWSDDAILGVDAGPCGSTASRWADVRMAEARILLHRRSSRVGVPTSCCLQGNDWDFPAFRWRASVTIRCKTDGGWQVVSMGDVQLRALFFAAPDDEYEFLTLAEAENAAGVQIEEGLTAILDGDCLSCFMVKDGQPIPPDLNRRFSSTPFEHRGASIVAALPILKTLDRRDPILVIDAGELFLMFVIPPDRLEQYVSTRYGEKVPLADPPENKYERWVVSIASSGSLMRRGVGLGPAPGIGRA